MPLGGSCAYALAAASATSACGISVRTSIDSLPEADALAVHERAFEAVVDQRVLGPRIREQVTHLLARRLTRAVRCTVRARGGDRLTRLQDLVLLVRHLVGEVER